MGHGTLYDVVVVEGYSTYEVRERAVKAVLSGYTVAGVAEIYQVHRATLHRWLDRYKQNAGFSGLERKPGSGRKRTMGRPQLRKLFKMVLRPASKFGYETDFWTCRRLIQVAWKELRVRVSQPTMWRMLRDWKFTYQKPQRRYAEASKTKRNAWIRDEVPKIKEIVRKYRAILYFQDESNISLHAVIAKTWAPKGSRPTQVVTGKRGGVSAMSAISSRGSLVFTLHDKRIASDQMIHFLRQLLKHHPRRHIVVVMDQASPHTSKKTRAFISQQKRLHVAFLPPYSPDFNPDEEVWSHLKHQELKSHQAKTKKELKKVARKKLKKMSGNPTLLKGIFFRCYVADILN
jgi:transposase